MADSVRLVIWDLDETFWSGTLTEGGITYRQECHNIVVELAQRGIMSTICSKNDPEPVRARLEQEGIWDYFIFPSINWEPKGPRIATLIETVQLRAPNILLIDDNPMNLNEARHFVPELQVESDAFIPGLLEDPRLRGKNDAKLTRLAQYKTLERRHAEEVQAVKQSGSNHEFLRSSGITVQLEYDLDDKIDRVVEMINRTNQMNFVKRRLSEDPAKAESEARDMLAQYDVQAALLRVTDRYGDYGYAGFYAMSNRPPAPKLLHFCFSCRILNMGVEQWLWRRLGRPELKVVQPVSSDPFDENVAADWIGVAGTAAAADAAAPATALGAVAIHGGCNLAAVGHYFRGAAASLIEEFDTARDNHGIRLDHSHMFRLALEGIGDAALHEAMKIGYNAADFRSLFHSLPPDALVLLSFTMDSALATYRHKHLDFRVPFWKPKRVPGKLSTDLTTVPEKIVQSLPPALRGAIEALRRDYEYEGPIPQTLFQENLRYILHCLPTRANIAILGASERGRTPLGKLIHFPRAAAINGWTQSVLADHSNAHFIDVAQFIEHDDEIETTAHFKRMVYFRIYRHLAQRFGAPEPAALQLAS